MTIKIFLLLVALTGSYSWLAPTTTPQPKPKPLKQNWGYVEVRPGAHMFYWAYFRPNYAKYPLVLWLQGGPGLSSSGVGNFLEVGPFDVNLKKKPHAWTESVSILFVDSPVGTGYSYVTNETLIPRNASEVAGDLALFLKKFYDKVAESLSCPLYVFGEGYGAKVGAYLAVLLNDMIKKKKIEAKLAGVALGDAWIAPADAAENYGRFLYSNSLIDNVGFSPITSQADKVKQATGKNLFNNATRYWKGLINDIQKLTNGVNLYNILNPIAQRNGNRVNSTHSKDEGPFDILVEPLNTELSGLMNGIVKKKLAVPQNVTWGNQSLLVWKALQDDLMTPGVKAVEQLLNTTKLPVMVYNGQLDLLVPSIGAEYWAQTMQWAGTSKWVQSKRVPILNKINHTVGYYKKFKNFSFYWILRAGHMVPLDAPETAFDMMKEFLGIKK